MRKAFIMLGLALGIGWGGTALAIGPGSDSSGEHTWTTECVPQDYGILDIRFTNTSDEGLIFSNPDNPSFVVAAGTSVSFTGNPGDPWEVRLLDGTVVDGGSFDECATEEPPPVEQPDDVSYTLECVGEDLIFADTGERSLRVIVSLRGGTPGYDVAAGQSQNFGTPGEDTADPGTRYEVWFEEPVGSDNFRGLREGNFPDCIGIPEEPENPTYSVTAEIVCAGPQIRVNNTGTGICTSVEQVSLTMGTNLSSQESRN